MKASQTKYPGTVVDSSLIGTLAWSNPGNAAGLQDPFTADAVTASVGVQTHYLIATGYGFSLPADAVVRGVSLSVRGKQTVTTTERCADNSIKLVVGGAPVGDNLADAVGSSWPTVLTSMVKGGPTSMWGNALPLSVLDANFGAAVSVIGVEFHQAGGKLNCSIESLPMTVYYEVPTLAHSPAHIMRQLLLDLGYGSVYATGEPAKPEDSLTVYNTAPQDDGRAMIDGETDQHYGLSFQIRGLRNSSVFARAQELQDTLDQRIRWNFVQLDGVLYIVHSVSKTQLIDANRSLPASKLALYSINAFVSIERR